MSWKRLLTSISLALFIMIADGLLLVAVNRIYLPQHPPHWMMGALFYFDAWPVTLTQHVFPGRAGGPSFLAIVTGALIDLVILTTLVYGLLTWRARRKTRG
jgi:hypothetical protein